VIQKPENMLDIFCLVIKEMFIDRKIMATIKPEYNDHTQSPKIVAVVERWLLA
jgi:hypothetical protein